MYNLSVLKISLRYNLSAVWRFFIISMPIFSYLLFGHKLKLTSGQEIFALSAVLGGAIYLCWQTIWATWQIMDLAEIYICLRKSERDCSFWKKIILAICLDMDGLKKKNITSIRDLWLK